MKVIDLRSELEALGESSDGLKPALVKRLTASRNRLATTTTPRTKTPRTPKRTPKTPRTPKRTPKTPRTPRSNTKRPKLSGHNVNRTSLDALDKECASTFGTGYKFAGRDECTQDTAHAKKQRDHLTSVLKRAEAIALQLRSSLQGAKQEYVSLASGMQLYASEFGTEAENMTKRSTALEKFVTSCVKLCGAILQNLEYCVNKKGTEKFERRCFDTDFMERAVSIGHEALQVITQMRDTLTLAKKKFSLTAGQWLRRAGRRVTELSKNFANGATRVFVQTLRFAAKHIVKLMIAAAIWTAMSTFVAPWLLNVTAAGKSLNDVCSAVQFTLSCFQNTLLLSGVVSLILSMKIPLVDGILDVVRKGIEAKYGGRGLQKVSVLYEQGVQNLMASGQGVNVQTLKEIGNDIALDTEKDNENKAIARGSASLALVAVLSFVTPVQNVADWVSYLLDPFCSGLQKLTHVIGNRGVTIFNDMFGTKFEYYGKFLNMSFLKELAVLSLKGSILDDEVENLTRGVMERVDQNKLSEIEFIIFPSISAENAKALKVEIGKELLAKRKRKGVGFSLKVDEELKKSLQIDIKRNIKKVREMVQKVLIAAIIVIVILAVVTLIMVHKYDTLDGFLGLLEDVNLSDADASEAVFRERIPVLKKRVAALKQCLLTENVVSCE
jgi:hypothetical protein